MNSALSLQIWCGITHLAQLRRQITNGPIRPLYRSWGEGQQHVGVWVSVCACVVCVWVYVCVLAYLGDINSGVVRPNATLLLLCGWPCCLGNIPVVCVSLPWWRSKRCGQEFDPPHYVKKTKKLHTFQQRQCRDGPELEEAINPPVIFGFNLTPFSV